ncbi:MAG: amino acid adenylation domain-containing protein [Gemmatimonadota bacterium]
MEDESAVAVAGCSLFPVPCSLAYVIYTSGSTGRPKGVAVTHGGLGNYLRWAAEAYGLDGGEGAPVHSSLGFDLTVTSLLLPLVAGRRVVMVPDSLGVEALAEAVRAERDLTLVKLTPRHLALLGEQLAPDEAAGRTRTFVVGGESLAPEDMAFWRRYAPATEIVNEYGPTETVVGCCVRRIAAGDVLSGAVPIGRPIANTRLYVLDRGLEPVPTGVAGELCVGGAGVSRGYLGRPGLTADRFVPDPFGGEPGARMYRTGDRARWLAAGELEFLGRADFQLKVRGFRIEPGEIEAALLEHPGVREAVVTARGEGAGRRLVAHVAGEGAADAARLREALRARLPEYMVPAAFVALERLPLTPNGKVDRAALPDPERGGPADGYAPPRDETEAALCRLWGEVLGVERVGVRDNFFELGGDSIVSIRVLARARVLGLECTLPDLFRHQTVEALAAHLGGGGGGARVERRPEVPPFGLLAAADRARLPAGVVDAFPATALQLGMIFHGEQDPASTLYHDLTCLRVRGPFDAGALGRALAAAMRRHAVLRSSFELSRFGEPLQLVYGELPAPLAVHDLGALAPEEREAAVGAAWEAEKGRRFDCARAPLFRVYAHRLGPDEFQLVLVHHHAILDGWSVATLLRELLDDYAAELGGTPSDAAPPRAEFREFVALEREAAASQEQREFWTRRLRDRPEARVAAPAGERGAWDGERIGVREAALPAALAEGAARLAREAGTPLKSVLLAAHLRVVALLGGGAEALTGLVSNGRPEGSDGERVLGLFLNTLPLGAALRGGSWLELVRETFAAERELLPFRRFPLAEMQRMLGGEALFDTAFNFVSFHVLDGALATGPLRVLEVRGHGSNSVPCMTIFSAGPGRLEMAVQHDRAAVPDALAARVWEWHRAALEAMTADPLSRCEAGLLSPAERARVLEEWNATGRAYPADACVHDLFAAQAARTPDAVAVSWRGEPTTYAELDRRSARLANALRRRGVGPESRVGVCLPRTPELVVALLGVLRAGGAYVPLDPAYPRERLGWMLEDAGIGLVLTASGLADRLPAGAADLLLLDREDLSAEPDDEPESGVGPENLSHVIFTSGSTGRPKGVMIRHASVVVLLHWLRETVSDEERASVLFSTSINFDVSVAEVFGTLCWGGKLVLVENALELASVAEPVVYASMVPSAAAELLRSGGIPASVRTLNLGGEALPAPLAQGLYALGTVERVGNLYGPTEDTTYSTYARVEPGAERVSVGRPVANTRAYVLDAHLEPSPVGIAGELYLSSDGLARGYASRPELTAERWLPDPFGAPGARMYRVMDRVRWTCDGELDYLGRTDHQVKVRGFRIELGEIEAALLAQDGVREAVAVVREDDAGDRRLAAYVVAGPEVDASGLRARLRDRLPEHMVPSAVVALERLPTTPNGKTDRRALPDPEWGGAVATRMAPRDGVEAALCALWGETLGAERVGALDDFFEVGGHSLAAVRLVARVNDAFGAALPVSALLHARTVRGMAEALREGGAGTAPSPLVPIRPGGSRPPFFCVHAAAGTVLPYLSLADALGPDQPFYGLEALPRAGGETSVEAMAEEYARAVRAVRPAGPYRLGGWSVGGVIAFEMARQLEAAGEEVELLALLDSYPPLDGTYGAEPGDVELLAFLARDLGYPRAELPALEERLAGEAPAGRAEALAAALAERVPAAAGLGAAELRERAEAYGRTLRAAARYRPAPYAGRVTLLLAAEGPAGPGDPRLGWSRLTPLPLDVRTAPGDHHGMLAGANAPALAALLRPRPWEPVSASRAPAPAEMIEITR